VHIAYNNIESRYVFYISTLVVKNFCYFANCERFSDLQSKEIIITMNIIPELVI